MLVLMKNVTQSRTYASFRCPPAGRSKSDKSQGARGTGSPALPTQDSEEPEI